MHPGPPTNEESYTSPPVWVPTWRCLVTQSPVTQTLVTQTVVTQTLVTQLQPKHQVGSESSRSFSVGNVFQLTYTVLLSPARNVIRSCLES